MVLVGLFQVHVCSCCILFIGRRSRTPRLKKTYRSSMVATSFPRSPALPGRERREDLSSLAPGGRKDRGIYKKGILTKTVGRKTKLFKLSRGGGGGTHGGPSNLP